MHLWVKVTNAHLYTWIISYIYVLTIQLLECFSCTRCTNESIQCLLLNHDHTHILLKNKGSKPFKYKQYLAFGLRHNVNSLCVVLACTRYVKGYFKPLRYADGCPFSGHSWSFCHNHGPLKLHFGSMWHAQVVMKDIPTSVGQKEFYRDLLSFSA